MMHVIYIASMVRSILALHKLIDNKEQRLWLEREATKKEREKADEKAKKEKQAKDAKDSSGEAAKDGSKGAETGGKK